MVFACYQIAFTGYKICYDKMTKLFFETACRQVKEIKKEVCLNYTWYMLGLYLVYACQAFYHDGFLPQLWQKCDQVIFVKPYKPGTVCKQNIYIKSVAFI